MSSYFGRFVRHFVSATSLVVSSHLCFGQGASHSATVASPLAQSFAAGRDLFAGGNLAGAEAALFNANVAPSGSGAWSLEAGTKLLQLAASFANRHDRPNAVAAAQAALAQLSDADSRLVAEGKPMTAARAQVLIGTIYEVFLHDDVAALQAYKRALAHDPNSAGAGHASDRLGNKTKG